MMVMVTIARKHTTNSKEPIELFSRMFKKKKITSDIKYHQLKRQNNSEHDLRNKYDFNAETD